MGYYTVTAANSKNGFKTETEARKWYKEVCEAGDGHACLMREAPLFEILAERTPYH